MRITNFRLQLSAENKQSTVNNTNAFLWSYQSENPEHPPERREADAAPLLTSTLTSPSSWKLTKDAAIIWTLPCAHATCQQISDNFENCF